MNSIKLVIILRYRGPRESSTLALFCIVHNYFMRFASAETNKNNELKPSFDSTQLITKVLKAGLHYNK